VTAFRILKRFHAVPTAWPAVANASWVASPAFSPYLNRQHETIVYPNFVFLTDIRVFLPPGHCTSDDIRSCSERLLLGGLYRIHYFVCHGRKGKECDPHSFGHLIHSSTPNIMLSKAVGSSSRALTDGVKRCQDDLAGHGGEECSPLLGADQRRRHGPGHRDDRVEQRLAHLLGHLRQLPDPEETRQSAKLAINISIDSRCTTRESMHSFLSYLLRLLLTAPGLVFLSAPPAASPNLLRALPAACARNRSAPL
jgi:hypothetical protein